MFKSNVNIVIDSENQVYIFTLSEAGDLSFQIWDLSLSNLEKGEVIQGEVLKFSSVIQKDDTIHLMSLSLDGYLLYHKYKDREWAKEKVAHFDLRSNYYHQFEMLLDGDVVHLFYNYSNLINSNIWTIQHIVYNSSKRYNVIRYISPKFPDSFSLDIDSQGIIHLLYPSVDNSNTRIYYSFFNPFAKRWSPHPRLVSRENTNCLYPILFIDSKDNIHSLWIEEFENQATISYHKSDSRGKEKFVWRKLSLPARLKNISYPLIFEESENLIVQLESDKTISVLSSDNFGETWLTLNKLEVKGTLEMARIYGNFSKSKGKYKFAFVSLSPSSKPKFYFASSYFDSQEESSQLEIKGDKERPWYYKIFK
ncbi:MAG: hypothetical protein WC983_04035 [Tissierellaceae bacterium]